MGLQLPNFSNPYLRKQQNTNLAHGSKVQTHPAKTFW